MNSICIYHNDLHISFRVLCQAFAGCEACFDANGQDYTRVSVFLYLLILYYITIYASTCKLKTGACWQSMMMSGTGNVTWGPACRPHADRWIYITICRDRTQIARGCGTRQPQQIDQRIYACRHGKQLQNASVHVHAMATWSTNYRPKMYSVNPVLIEF